MNLIDKAYEIMQERGLTLCESYIEAGGSTPSGKTYKAYKKKYGEESQRVVNRKNVLGNAKHGWIKEDGHSVFYKNEETIEDIIDKSKKVFSELSRKSVKKKKIKYKDIEDPHLLVIDLADLHIGKLASQSVSNDTYNIDIAYDRAVKGVEGLISKSKGFDIEKILFVIGNDVLHIDTPSRKTTSGTPQDTDGMWSDSFESALNLYIQLIDSVKDIAPVHCVFNPSNHDYMSGYMLSMATKSWFHNDPNVTFEVNLIHRKYFKYGNNLIGTTHGDGAKDKDLGKHMANESKDWSDTSHRYFYLHHLHHYRGFDDIGITLEYMRSTSGTDRWHNDNGYVSKKATQAFVHHKEHGQVAKFSHYF